VWTTTTSPTVHVQLLGISTLFDTTLTPLAATGSINWLEESFAFTADSTTTRLSFVDTSGSDDNASFLDNVSVSEVPEPMTLLSLGLIALLVWRRR
jgi:PEP-CTERM motif